tara:strand:- start:452 stop:583 length:132 start_codon:yes stop_codon:yes gene_type:complete
MNSFSIPEVFTRFISFDDASDFHWDFQLFLKVIFEGANHVSLS